MTSDRSLLAPLPVVAIVGLPNAGKSTLFNRIVPGRTAIVDSARGVTRDRNVGIGKAAGRSFLLVDTGGFEDADGSALAQSVRDQAALAAEEADVILVLLDGRAGINPDDRVLVNRLRALTKPVVFAVNKIDHAGHESRVIDFFELGVDDLAEISAAHGIGIGSLFKRIVAHFPEGPEEEGASAEDVDAAEVEALGADVEADGEADGEADAETSEADERANRPVRFALIGRPNAGKSSLLNRLVGYERSIVDSTPGTTRDALDTPCTLGGREYVIVDTAGIRRRSKVVEHVERVSAVRALSALERAEVAVLVIDASEGMTDQDARIAGYAWERGRALLLAFNKWDLLPEGQRSRKHYFEEIAYQYPTLADIPAVALSALEGTGLKALVPALEKLVVTHRRTLQTADLNRILKGALEAHTPRCDRGRPPRIYYATQTRKAPPTITLFVSNPSKVTRDYIRYLTNTFRTAFELKGTPLQVRLRKREH